MLEQMILLFYTCTMLDIVNSRHATNNVKHSNLRIINGDKDIYNVFPFAVVIDVDYDMEYMDRRNGTSIMKSTRKVCSGSLISEVWVLTAAHCLDPELERVRFGDVNTQNGLTKTSKILKQIPHPSYYHMDSESMSYTKNDIALLLVDRIKNRPLTKISGVDYKGFIGRSAYIAGFGYTSYTDSKNDFESYLKVAGMLIVPCTPDEFNSGPWICLTPSCMKTQTTHYTDSGGPLIVDAKLVGVCHGDSFDIMYYTPVSPYISWLRKTMKKKKELRVKQVQI